jgi:hypothetical protein
MAAFLTAIVVTAVAGLSLMLGGAMALKTGAGFGGEIIGPFMAMTFLLLLVVEIFLCRQLSRVTSNPDKALPPPITTTPQELNAAQQRALREPLQSVTENTTRTLEYAKHEPSQR